MIIISAMSRERVIGSRNGLPWNVPGEYRQFLDFVRGQTVLFGRTSYEIFGNDLRESRLVVVSSSVRTLPNAEVHPTFEAAVEAARAHGTTVFCAGGASIYRQTRPLATRMYLSFMKGEFSGDVYFPEFDEAEWQVTETRDHPEFEFRIYLRISR